MHVSFFQDGSAVEIVGLSYACLRELSALHARGAFRHGAVSRSTDGVSWTPFLEKKDILVWRQEHKEVINTINYLIEKMAY